MAIHKFEVLADYHQFYVWDSGVNPEAPEDYTDEDVSRMVKVAKNVVVVQPVRDLDVPVELELCPSDPGCELATWDHVVECSVEIPSGKLQVHECTGGAVFDAAIAPGNYRVRVLFAGLGTLSYDGVDGDDRYRVVLWPGDIVPLTVIKQWRSDDAG